MKLLLCIAISFSLLGATHTQSAKPVFEKVTVPKNMVTILEEPEVKSKDQVLNAKNPEVLIKDAGVKQDDAQVEIIDANIKKEAIVEKKKFAEMLEQKKELNTVLKNLITKYEDMIASKKAAATELIMDTKVTEKKVIAEKMKNKSAIEKTLKSQLFAQIKETKSKIDKIENAVQKRIDSTGKVSTNQEVKDKEIEIGFEIIKKDAKLEKVATLKTEVEILKKNLKREKNAIKREYMVDIIISKEKITKSMIGELQTETKSIIAKRSIIEDLKNAKVTKKDLIKETVKETRKCAAYTVRPSRKYCSQRDAQAKCLKWKSIYRTSTCLIYKDGKCVQTDYKYDNSASRYECISKDQKMKIESCSEFKSDGTCKVTKTLYGVKECSSYNVTNGKIVCVKHEIYFPEYTCIEKHSNGKCKLRKFYKPRFFCKIYKQLNGTRFCSTMKEYYSEKQHKLVCLKDSDKGCMSYDMIEEEREESKRIVIVRYKEATTEIKNRKELIESAKKESTEAKEMIKKFAERLRHTKDRKVIKEITIIIDKQNRAIKQTEETINTEIKRIEHIKKVKKAMDLVKKADVLRKKAELEKDITQKKEAKSKVEIGASNHEVRTADQVKIAESKETLLKIQKYEKYLEERRTAENNMIKIAKKVIVEQKKKLESTDRKVVIQAKQIIAQQKFTIKKSEVKRTEIEANILKKWRFSKVITFAQDLIRKKAQTIEKQVEIIEKNNKLVKDMNAVIKTIKSQKERETIEKKITEIQKETKEATIKKGVVVTELGSVSTKLDARFGKKSLIIKETIKKYTAALKKVDASKKKITEYKKLLKQGAITITSISHSITMKSIQLEKITDLEKKAEMRAKIEVQKVRLDEEKILVTKKQGKMVKEMFKKWKNMSNVKLIVKEADEVNQQSAETLKIEQQSIIQHTIIINGKKRQITISNNTQEISALRTEILSEQRRVIRAKKTIEVQEKRIIEAEKIIIERLPLEKSIREATKVIKLQTALIRDQKGVIKDAGSTIERQTEFLKRNVSKEEIRKATIVITRERKRIFQAQKQIVKYGKVIRTVNRAKISKQIAFIKKSKLSKAEKECKNIIKEMSYTISKREGKRHSVNATVKTLKSKLAKVTDPKIIAKITHEIKEAETKIRVYDIEIITDKVNMVKIQTVKWQRQKPTIVRQEATAQLKLLMTDIKKIAKNIKVFNVVIENYKKKVDSCSDNKCRQAITIKKVHTQVKLRRLEQSYETVTKVTYDVKKVLKTTLLKQTIKRQRAKYGSTLQVTRTVFRAEDHAGMSSLDRKEFKIFQRSIKQWQKKFNLNSSKPNQAHAVSEYFEKVGHFWRDVVKHYISRVRKHKDLIKKCRNEKCKAGHMMAIQRYLSFNSQITNKLSSIDKMQRRVDRIVTAIEKTQIKHHLMRKISSCNTKTLRKSLITIRSQRRAIIANAKSMLKDRASAKEFGLGRRASNHYARIIATQRSAMRQDSKRVKTTTKNCNQLVNMANKANVVLGKTLRTVISKNTCNASAMTVLSNRVIAKHTSMLNKAQTEQKSLRAQAIALKADSQAKFRQKTALDQNMLNRYETLLDRERRKVIKERRRIIRVIKVCTSKKQTSSKKDCKKLIVGAQYLIGRRQRIIKSLKSKIDSKRTEIRTPTNKRYVVRKQLNNLVEQQKKYYTREQKAIRKFRSKSKGCATEKKQFRKKCRVTLAAVNKFSNTRRTIMTEARSQIWKSMSAQELKFMKEWRFRKIIKSQNKHLRRETAAQKTIAARCVKQIKAKKVDPSLCSTLSDQFNSLRAQRNTLIQQAWTKIRFIRSHKHSTKGTSPTEIIKSKTNSMVKIALAIRATIKKCKNSKANYCKMLTSTSSHFSSSLPKFTHIESPVKSMSAKQIAVLSALETITVSVEELKSQIMEEKNRVSEMTKLCKLVKSSPALKVRKTFSASCDEIVLRKRSKEIVSARNLEIASIRGKNVRKTNAIKKAIANEPKRLNAILSLCRSFTSVLANQGQQSVSM